ncbi:MAG: putative dioxygenase of extradiol dioxygenase family [Algoriphagus marincola HL-49]|uniref:Putative dioxygenase of extradiol dioxygenase family n=1 Tax=Algoriphagus marincola HL-49 TaxID=1305737 RepID=A0A0P7YC98_9BACT|nr:MAG: putative dioxygenase of extradiol dioxygenase family [Algoriphagus marincola HL-49]
MSEFKPFHLAFPIRDIEETRAFYGELLGCDIGRSTDKWIDFNFFGHQLSAHIKPEELAKANTNAVDGKNVPVRHFGVILPWDEWHDLADKLKSHGIDFVIEPYIRFKGEVGEQATMFFLDPCGNALEFKSFQDESQIFAK